MTNTPTLALFGLGRMGGQIARRLHKNNFKVFAWNRSPEPVVGFKKFGGFASSDIGEVVEKLKKSADDVNAFGLETDAIKGIDGILEKIENAKAVGLDF